MGSPDEIMEQADVPSQVGANPNGSAYKHGSGSNLLEHDVATEHIVSGDRVHSSSALNSLDTHSLKAYAVSDNQTVEDIDMETAGEESNVDVDDGDDSGSDDKRTGRSRLPGSWKPVSQWAHSELKKLNAVPHDCSFDGFMDLISKDCTDDLTPQPHQLARLDSIFFTDFQDYKNKTRTFKEKCAFHDTYGPDVASWYRDLDTFFAVREQCEKLKVQNNTVRIRRTSQIGAFGVREYMKNMPIPQEPDTPPPEDTIPQRRSRSKVTFRVLSSCAIVIKRPRDDSPVEEPASCSKPLEGGTLSKSARRRQTAAAKKKAKLASVTAKEQGIAENETKTMISAAKKKAKCEPVIAEEQGIVENDLKTKISFDQNGKRVDRNCTEEESPAMAIDTVTDLKIGQALDQEIAFLNNKGGLDPHVSHGLPPDMLRNPERVTSFDTDMVKANEQATRTVLDVLLSYFVNPFYMQHDHSDQGLKVSIGVPANVFHVGKPSQRVLQGDPQEVTAKNDSGLFPSKHRSYKLRDVLLINIECKTHDETSDTARFKLRAQILAQSLAIVQQREKNKKFTYLPDWQMTVYTIALVGRHIHLTCVPFTRPYLNALEEGNLKELKVHIFRSPSYQIDLAEDMHKFSRLLLTLFRVFEHEIMRDQLDLEELENRSIRK